MYINITYKLHLYFVISAPKGSYLSIETRG